MSNEEIISRHKIFNKSVAFINNYNNKNYKGKKKGSNKTIGGNATFLLGVNELTWLT